MPRPNGYQSLHTSVISEKRHAVRGADPDRGDAPAGRGGHRGALEIQGRPHRRSARRALLPVDAPAARMAAGGPRPAGVHPQPEDRPLSRGGLHLHAARRSEGAAAGRDAARLRLRDSHRRRPPLRRRAGERQDGAASHAAEERRHRRDHHAGRPHAQPRLAELRRHLTRAAEDPPLRPARGEGAQHRARTKALREGREALRPEPEDAGRERRVREGRRGVRQRQGRRGDGADRLRTPRGANDSREARARGAAAGETARRPRRAGRQARAAAGRGPHQGQRRGRPAGLPRALLQSDSRREDRRLHQPGQGRRRARGDLSERR